jgi:peptidoglycan-associated lipoprotein
MKKRHMRWIVTMVVILICFVGMAGCSKKAVQQGDTIGAAGPAQASAPAAKAPGSETMVQKTPLAAEEEAGKKVAATAKPDRELADIHFDYDKSALRAKDREILKGHAEWLLKNKNYAVIIEGHCDERGTTEYNLALGERRAVEAMNYLVGLGVVKDRIKTISYGEERPLDPGHNEDAWAKNRRGHFVVSIK